MAEAKSPNRDDLITAMVIGAMAYALSVLLHEGIGHGSVCALVSPDSFVVSTAELQCGTVSRAVAAAGPVSNLIVGTILLLILPRLHKVDVRWRFFLWFVQGYNLFMGAGYFLFSGVSGLGDWANVLVGVEPQWLVRSAETLLGVVLYYWTGRISARYLVRYILGACDAGRIVRVCVIPYLVAGLAAGLAALLSSDGWNLVFISALPSSLGGGCAFVWMMSLAPPLSTTGQAGAAIGLRRSVGWISAGLLVLAVFVFVFGPGVTI